MWGHGSEVPWINWVAAHELIARAQGQGSGNGHQGVSISLFRCMHLYMYISRNVTLVNTHSNTTSTGGVPGLRDGDSDLEHMTVRTIICFWLSGDLLKNTFWKTFFVWQDNMSYVVLFPHGQGGRARGARRERTRPPPAQRLARLARVSPRRWQ